MDKFKNAWLLLEKLMDSSLDSIYFKDCQSRFKMLNQACAAKHGWATPEEGVGKSDFDTFSDEHARKAFEDEQRIIATGIPLVGVEERETWTDGHVSWCSTSKMPLIDEDGSVFGIIGITRDITDRKEAEIEALRYSEEVNSIKERMEEDVRMAARLQNTFFPRSYPTYPQDASKSESCIEFSHRHHASELVSGDFCTVRRLSESEAGIFICDVMGHGVRAALGTALICAIYEDLAGHEKDPGLLLQQMNNNLLPMLQHEDEILFASACCMVLDAATGELHVANAGHPAPLLLNGAKNTASLLSNQSHDSALGLVEGTAYQTLTEKLQPGDKVILYTDGLYEAARDDGEEFGGERLMAAARQLLNQPISQLIASLMNHTMLFTEGRLTDDICLVALHYKQQMTPPRKGERDPGMKDGQSANGRE